MQPSCKNRSVPKRNGAQGQLGKAGLRRTKARECILGTLLEADRPLTHQQISAQLTAVDIDKVTLYRTLNKLKDTGLVHAVQGIGGTLLFCANPVASVSCPGNHAHFQCRGCGAMQCIEAQKLPRIVMTSGAQVETKQLVAFGLCPVCAQSRRPKQEKGASTQHQPSQNPRRGSPGKGHR